ncbi:alpha/beta hydrolase [Aequorivita antarctica]|uniref:Alpha/beta hydrolase n=1 Tax=Aequorivita antarctica TaxID=153266 RepID=A0A5C6YZX6_9FLAO|nr:alpha/beta hydrolase [Aequorivita antarctica]TXD73271.1 alpha/beta hydrolase [Aequorivita antarctica]SRX76024.1 Haloalkane dehalogenase [Aequorivita antarctica]
MKAIKWIKKILLGIFILMCSMLIIGVIYEYVSRLKGEKIIPDGQFADIGGHKLHYLKQGESGPTIVFEAAFDPTGHLQWHNLQNEVSKFATTISYDRAGILWSERGNNPKSGEKMAEELYLLLEKINAPKPYILVGHSLGGMLIRFYMDQYPKEVAGIILIDSECPNDEDYLSPELYAMVSQGLPEGFLKFANSVGLARLIYKDMFPDTKEYEYQNTVMPALLHKSAYGILEEGKQDSFIKKEAKKIKNFGNTPLYVLSAIDENRFDQFIKDSTLNTEMVNAWNKMQRDMLKLSTNSKQILVPNSSHYINQDQPTVIEDAIKNMVNELE